MAGAAEISHPALPSGWRADIEAWFVRRGVPQLIDDYASERKIDARARPFIALWLVGGSFLWWGTRPDAPLWLNFVWGVLLLAAVAVGVAAIRKMRGQIMWWVDRRLEVLDTFSLGPLIAVPSAIIEGSWATGVANGVNALVGMGVIYFVMGLGLREMAWWSLKRLRQELAQITGLLARTLPILLVLVLFLLFAAELWEAAHLLSPIELLAALTLPAAVAVLLILTAFRSEMRVFEGSPVDQLQSLVAATPAAPLADAGADPRVPELGTLQRLNLSVLVAVSQLMQSGFVAVTVALFLVIFGILALPASLQERWIGEATTTLAGFELLGERRALSLELVTTACLLGGVVGLYFTGLAVTDSDYRTAHFDSILGEVRQIRAVHAFYVEALDGLRPE